MKNFFKVKGTHHPNEGVYLAAPETGARGSADNIANYLLLFNLLFQEAAEECL